MNRRNFLKSYALTGFSLGLAGCGEGLAIKSAAAPRPNILFCIADDASYPHMGAYGCNWVKTPGFDRVAKQGILFTNAYTPNAKCAPSRSCILTGRNSWQLEEAANHWCNFPAKFKTYAEALRDTGYFTGYTAKGWGPGNPGKVGGQPRPLLGPAYNARKTSPPTSGIANIDYTGNFSDFLNQCPDGTPFCFWYGSHEPHRKYEYGSGAKKGNKNIVQLDRVPRFWPDNEVVRTDMLDYAFEIEYFDEHLCRMLVMLEEKGELANTIVIVTSDNGMPFPRAKGQEYEYSNHMPLAIMWKNAIKNPGRVVDDFVSFIDFAPTFLDVAGISQRDSGMKKTQGKSLTGIFYSGQEGIVDKDRNHILIGKERHDVGRPDDQGYPIRGIVKGSYLYIRNFESASWPAGNPETGYLNTDGSPTKTEILNGRRTKGQSVYWQMSFGKRPPEELYCIRDDRACLENLAPFPEYYKIKRALKKQLESELKQQGDPRMFGRGHIFDEYEYVNQSSRNFYNRYQNGEKPNFEWVNKTDFEPEPIE